ncbi:hypothetical protein N9I77_03545 [Cyclobacteriaceae bacterium]|jgi:hypothetical protein|nr:hypothetical protein [Cyclobacteriaceae bacterium]|tara:strand:- start:1011 stop:1667 length:657 start_codon:yes stop_codon:yes gene_type:complete
MEKIEFEMWGLQLLEPMALILNLVMSFQSFLYYQKIRASFASPFSAYFSKFFLFISISTFFAAWSHLFYNYLGLVGKIPGWATSIISISMLEYAMVIYLYPKGNILLKSIIAILIASAFGLLIFELKFLWVAIHTAIGIVLFLGVPFSIRIAKGTDQVGFFFWGFISLLILLPVEVLRLNLHPWFQHHEISHIFMICALYCFSKGVRQTELMSSKVKV